MQHAALFAPILGIDGAQRGTQNKTKHGPFNLSELFHVFGLDKQIEILVPRVKVKNGTVSSSWQEMPIIFSAKHEEGVIDDSESFFEVSAGEV